MRTLSRLTINKIRNAIPGRGGKTALLCDGGGLWLQISAGKDGKINKSWIFRYAAADNKISRTGREYRRERQMGLGPLYTVGLAEAREMARSARLLVLQGKDPLDQKDAARAAARAAQSRRQTFGAAAEAYLQRFEDTWKSARHRLQWRTSLQTYILPALGKVDIDEIDTEFVLKVLDPIWSTRPETASRVRGRIETILDFAGHSGPNPARWKGHLEHKLAKRNKARTVRHLAALPYSEMAAFMAELRMACGVPARALEFTILCATRTNETIGALWGELDLHSRLWIVPAIRTKRDREHGVPLSDAAMAVIDAMAKIRQDERVFPIGSDAMWHFLRGLRSGLTVHGFRATFRSWAGACTMHPRDVCETALGHTIGTAVEQAYQRDTLIAKRRVLMADWAEFCASDRVANVVRMDAGRQRSTPENADLSTGFGGKHIRPGISA
jgi:integrase